MTGGRAPETDHRQAATGARSSPPPELLGIHTNMPGIFPNDIDKAAFSGAPAPSGLSVDEKVAYDRLQFVYQKGIAYGVQMGLRPQTLYGIADSPVGLAAYFLDHDALSYALISRSFTGESEGLTRDDILDNITILVGKFATAEGQTGKTSHLKRGQAGSLEPGAGVSTSRKPVTLRKIGTSRAHCRARRFGGPNTLGWKAHSSGWR
jgi:hypothetical protein